MWLHQSHSFQILVYCMMAVFWAKPGGWEKRKTAESCFDPCHILSKRVKLGRLNWTFRELFWSNLPAAEDLLLLMFLLLGKQKIEIDKKNTWNSIPNTLFCYILIWKIEIGIAHHKVQESWSWNDDGKLFCIGFHLFIIWWLVFENCLKKYIFSWFCIFSQKLEATYIKILNLYAL